MQRLEASGETRTAPDQTGTLVRAVVDGWDLDQYLFRAASPLDFAIDVDHDFGPVDAAGHPTPGNALHGLTGRITLRVFDVDDDAPSAPEVDHVYVNGVLVGTLSGADNQWSINTFEFPLVNLLLPTTTNPSGHNEFQVDIDTTNSGWAVEVDWAELRLNEDFVPLAMVHGFTSSGETWTTFKDYVDANSFLDPADISTPTHSSANIETSVAEIETPIDELLTTSGAYHLDIIAHSMGGLISRLYAWDNPSRVNKLIMNGTPNGGGALADAMCYFKNANGPWAGPIWALELIDDQLGDCKGPEDALFQFQTSYVQNVFNAQVRDRTGTEYWVVGGDLPGEGRLFDLIPGADDGVVALDSAQYLLMDRPDHPGKHRLLGTLPLEHGALISDGSAAMPLAVCKLYGTQCDIQGASVMQSQVAAHAGDQVISDFHGVQVAPGGSGSLDLTFEGAGSASVILISDHLDAIAVTLAGATFEPAKLFETDVLAAELASPVDGQLHVTNSGSETAGVLAIVGLPAGRALEVTTSATLVDPGAPVEITVSLSEAASGEVVVAEVAAPSGSTTPVSLTETAPGAWSGAITPTESGIHFVTAWAEGSRPRADSTLVTVSSGLAQLTGAFSERLEGAEDGLADALVVAPEVTLAAGGSYRLAADLADANGTVIASAGVTADMPMGTSAPDLSFSGRAIFEAGIDGPYRIVNVAVSRADAGLTLEDAIDELGSTAFYDHRAFDHFPILIDRASFADSGIDADTNGGFESLQIDFSARVEVAGTYALNARLLAPDGSEVAEAQSTPTLTAGANALVLQFDAESIAAAGLDGPYTVADLSLYPIANADQLGYLVTAYQTGPYTAVQFGALPAAASGRVSVSTAGEQGNGPSGASKPSAVSDDGRYVAFVSDASNLVPGDTNGVTDVFVRDRQAGATARVSVTSTGTQANALSEHPAISGDGRYVTFTTAASNVVTGDTNGQRDVFVHDRQTGVTSRVSIATAGTQANGASGISSISDDGRYVAFAADASNLVAGDTNKKTDVFVRDRQTQTTSRASVTSGGAQGNGTSSDPAISADGRYLVYTSEATNLVAADTNRKADILVRDRQAGTTTRVSVLSDGTQPNAGSEQPAISGDGRYVVFVSFATNLVPNDTNQAGDVFIHDRQAGTTTRVSVTASGGNPDDRAFNPSISDDGTSVAFASKATNLASGNPDNSYDAYVRDLPAGSTVRVSVADDGTQGNSHSGQGSVELSGDGRHVVFDSTGSNLVSGDTNGVSDVFVRSNFAAG